MICKDRVQAGRVSAIGADKAEAAGYSVVASEQFPGVFYVVKPGGAGRYHVEETPQGFTCKCAFFAANKRHGVCKHSLLVIRHKAAEEAHIAALVAEFTRPIDCEEIDAFAYLTHSPRISFPIASFAQYEAAANLPNLTGSEREELCYAHARLYKRAI